MTFLPQALRIFGYASLCPNDHFCELECDLLSELAESTDLPVEIFAEEYHPSHHRRPYFNEVRQIIRRGKADVLIVPSLFHIAGGERARMEKFLTFLHTHGVRLMSLKEKIDSRFLNDTAILDELGTACPAKCKSAEDFN